MSYLSKKSRKYYSALITDKLEAMGIKDEITMVPSGKKRKVMRLDDTGRPVVENGKIQTEDQDIMRAQNKLRSTVRNLRKQPEEVILAFLNMESPEKK